MEVDESRRRGENAGPARSDGPQADERDVKKAEREAEEAAADALDYALRVVDQAELAVLTR